MLNIKTMLWITQEGKIETLEKIRTRPKAIERLKEKFLEEVANVKKLSAFIVYTNNIDFADEIADDIQKARPDIKDMTFMPLTPVVGASSTGGSIWN